ncbi:hypothetical protein K439DRAFT_561940 [Ramaria rubella]|nr:hypothetical protein K439DRAFT_561940 [Ramaria rubella]
MITMLTSKELGNLQRDVNVSTISHRVLGYLRPKGLFSGAFQICLGNAHPTLRNHLSYAFLFHIPLLIDIWLRCSKLPIPTLAEIFTATLTSGIVSLAGITGEFPEKNALREDNKMS